MSQTLKSITEILQDSKVEAFPERLLEMDFSKISFRFGPQEMVKLNGKSIAKLSLHRFYQSTLIKALCEQETGHYDVVSVHYRDGEKQLRSLPPELGDKLAEIRQFSRTFQRGVHDRESPIITETSWSEDKDKPEPDMYYQYRYVHEAMIQSLMKWHQTTNKSPLQIIVFGCGYGREIPTLLKAFSGQGVSIHIVGLDFAEKRVKAARELCADAIKSKLVEIHSGNHQNIQPLLEQYRSKDPTVKTVAFFSGAISELVFPVGWIMPVLWELHQVDCAVISGIRPPWTKPWQLKKAGFDVTLSNFRMNKEYEVHRIVPTTDEKRISYLRNQMKKREYHNRELDLVLSADPLHDLAIFEPKNSIDLIDLRWANVDNISSDAWLTVLAQYRYLKVIRTENDKQFSLTNQNCPYAVQTVKTRGIQQTSFFDESMLKKMQGEFTGRMGTMFSELLKTNFSNKVPPHLPTTFCERLGFFPFTKSSAEAQMKADHEQARQAWEHGDAWTTLVHAFSMLRLCSKQDAAKLSSALMMLYKAQCSLNYHQAAIKTSEQLHSLANPK